MDLKKIKPVRIKQPHFIWPEKEKKIALKLSKYFLTNKIGKNGLPDIIEKFESNFKKENKSKYCLALSSGTAALHIAYLASGIKMNDEVIISDYTFPATVIPLFLYVRGVELIGLGPTGMIFYITPTLQFLLGFFYYNEEFSLVKFASFIIIWIAVIIYLKDLYETN